MPLTVQISFPSVGSTPYPSRPSPCAANQEEYTHLSTLRNTIYPTPKFTASPSKTGQTCTETWPARLQEEWEMSFDFCLGKDGEGGIGPETHCCLFSQRPHHLCAEPRAFVYPDTLPIGLDNLHCPPLAHHCLWVVH